MRPIRVVRGIHKGGAPSVSRGRVSRKRVRRPPPAATARVRNAANHTTNMKMGINYRIRTTSNAVAGHTRAGGPVTARRVRGRR
jgi:hypothetical protein